MPFEIPVNLVSLTGVDHYLWFRGIDGVGLRATMKVKTNVRPLYQIHEGAIFPAYHAPFTPDAKHASAATGAVGNEQAWYLYNTYYAKWTIPTAKPVMDKMVIRYICSTSTGGVMQIYSNPEPGSEAFGDPGGTLLGTVDTSVGTNGVMRTVEITLAATITAGDVVMCRPTPGGNAVRLSYWLAYDSDGVATDDDEWYAPTLYAVTSPGSTMEFAYQIGPTGQGSKLVGGYAHNAYADGYGQEDGTVLLRWYRNSDVDTWTPAAGWTTGTFRFRVNSVAYFAAGTPVGDLDYTYGFERAGLRFTSRFEADGVLTSGEMYPCMFAGTDAAFETAQIIDGTSWDLTGEEAIDPLGQPNHAYQVPAAKLPAAQRGVSFLTSPLGQVARVRLLSCSKTVTAVFFRHEPANDKDKVYFGIAGGAIANGVVLTAEWFMDFASRPLRMPIVALIASGVLGTRR